MVSGQKQLAHWLAWSPAGQYIAITWQQPHAPCCLTTLAVYAADNGHQVGCFDDSSVLNWQHGPAPGLMPFSRISLSWSSTGKQIMAGSPYCGTGKSIAIVQLDGSFLYLKEPRAGRAGLDYIFASWSSCGCFVHAERRIWNVRTGALVYVHLPQVHMAPSASASRIWSPKHGVFVNNDLAMIMTLPGRGGCTTMQRQSLESPMQLYGNWTGLAFSPCGQKLVGTGMMSNFTYVSPKSDVLTVGTKFGL